MIALAALALGIAITLRAVYRCDGARFEDGSFLWVILQFAVGTATIVGSLIVIIAQAALAVTA